MDTVRHHRIKKRHRQQKKRKNGPRKGGVSLNRQAEGKREPLDFPTLFNLQGGIDNGGRLRPKHY